ncbi:hypothetical protein [Nocardia bovistercoris]|uniref:ATP synthase epsilon chain n=1 Tax=Nocardia bovistercoris TaxID=2785916 RepID=A0A931IG60_9NOCA|nr:hypothetical protein [Nocardia bovistercoris]MBH0780839.1 hypothetical protein [Nocardia bovistercoris]
MMRRSTVVRVRPEDGTGLSVTLAVPGYRAFAFTATALRVPTATGELLIEAGHPSCVIPLDIGPFTVDAGARTWLAALHGGELRVADDEIDIVAATIEFADRIDVDRARAAQADAAHRLEHDRDDRAALLALRRANVRLAVAARVHPSPGARR